MKVLRNLLSSLFLLAALNAVADEDMLKAKKVFETYKDSVVNISFVLSTDMTLGGNPLPSKDKNVETKATVFSKDLIVTSYSNLDSTVLQGLTEFRGQKIEVKASFKDVKLIASDGSEIPLKVVLVDKDQNLAFLAFDKAHSDYREVKLVEAGFEKEGSAGPLDKVINISRLDKELYRSPAVKQGYITARVEKPRVTYLASIGESGTPLYKLDGSLIGLVTVKLGAKKKMIVIPVKDLNTIAQQAVKKI